MKNTTVILMIVILVLAGGWFTFINGKNVSTGSTVLDIKNTEAQEIVLSQKGYNYEDISAEAEKPIKISADDSVSGCLRSVVFNFDGKKYSKYLKTTQDVLELPALSKGSYTFSCTMGMGLGKLFVE
jgi:plastocyanin domain-containing protein